MSSSHSLTASIWPQTVRSRGNGKKESKRGTDTEANVCSFLQIKSSIAQFRFYIFMLCKKLSVKIRSLLTEVTSLQLCESYCVFVVC